MSAFSVVNSAQLSGKAGAVKGGPVYDFGVEKKRTSFLILASHHARYQASAVFQEGFADRDSQSPHGVNLACYSARQGRSSSS